MRKKIFFPLVFIFSLFFSLNVFAASLPSLSDVLNYFAYNYTGVCLPADVYRIFNEWFLDNQSDENKVHGGHGFSRGDDYVNDNVTFNSDGTTDLSLDLQFTFNQFILDYINEHPLSYSRQWIFGYDAMPADWFSTPAQRNSIINLVSSSGADYFFFPGVNKKSGNNQVKDWDEAVNYVGKTNSKIIIFCTDNNKNKNINIDLYSSGHLNDFIYTTSIRPSYNWSGYSWRDDLTDNQYGYIVANDGSVKRFWKFYGQSYDSSFANTNLNLNSSGSSIFLCRSGKEVHYVYDSIDALKIYDTGQPASYYVTDSFNVYNFQPSSSYVVNNNQAINNANLYNQIVNSISSGQSANDLNITINNIIDSNNDKPVEDNPSDDDDKESLWDKIKDSVKDFFSAIAEVIREIVSLIVDTVLGVLTELIRGFKDILSTIKEFLLDSDSGQGFISILGAFFDWLPEPIPLFLKSIFTLACVFALIKMIKGLAS